MSPFWPIFLINLVGKHNQQCRRKNYFCLWDPSKYCSQKSQVFKKESIEFMCLWSLAAARPCLLVPPPLKRQSRSDFHHFPNPPPWSHLLPVNFVSTVNLTSYTHWVNWKNRTLKIFWKKGDGKAIFVLKNMYIFPGKRSWVTHECQNKHSGGLKSRPNVPRVESPVWVQKVLCSSRVDCCCYDLQASPHPHHHQ